MNWLNSVQSKNPIKVAFSPCHPHSLVYGGFEIQMLSALAAIGRVGINAFRLDPWARDLSYGILHIWGLEVSHLPAVMWARRRGIGVVATTLLDDPDKLVSRLRLRAAEQIGSLRILSTIAEFVDDLVVVNDRQAMIAHRKYGHCVKGIHVIPNIVGEAFYSSTPHFAGQGGFGLDDFVLCTGNICQRKNQLSLARACRLADLPLLLIGDSVAGEERYAEEVRLEVSRLQDGLWLPGVDQHSPNLHNAYLDAAVFALPSYSETQPISALEAAVCSKPLVLSDLPYARQVYFAGAQLVKPDRVESIAEGLKAARLKTQIGRIQYPHLEQFRAESVAASYVGVYRGLLERKHLLVGDLPTTTGKS